MVQQVAVEAVSQSQKKQNSSLGWYSFVCSKIVAGFEAYGLAVIGMMPLERR
ncbi:MAG TPA: hypothetical protein VGF82_23380 [Terracidiphilus sp.]|jgi:hypothetical protein